MTFARLNFGGMGGLTSRPTRNRQADGGQPLIFFLLADDFSYT